MHDHLMIGGKAGERAPVEQIGLHQGMGTGSQEGRQFGIVCAAGEIVDKGECVALVGRFPAGLRPMNPAPPVIRIFMRSCRGLWNEKAPAGT